jgi:transcriptional regulator with XRE-family HTH domain
LPVLFGKLIRRAMEQLVRLRELKGYSQRALAKESGVSPATIYELENGRRRPNPSTLRKLAGALEVEVADLLGGEYPKGRSSSLEPTFNDVLEEDRRLRYLRPWRAFVHGLARRWEKEPPKTSREIAPLYEALTAVVKQGVFDPPEQVSPSEGHELMLLTVGFQRLNEIANKVEQDEERNAIVRDIREKFSA